MVVRIDSHQHFWRLDRGDYQWLTPEMKAIYRDYLPEDLSPLLKETGVDKTVIVQAAASLAETEFILELAQNNSFVAGVVGWVDMESANAIKDLEKLSGSPLLRGIRPLIQDIPDSDWMLKPVLSEVYDYLIDQGLTFDALVKPIHLKNLLTLLKRYPTLKVVIDHGAKPGIAEGQFQPWADDILQVAQNTQALCKLSGLVTEAGQEPSYERLQPYMEHLLYCFGPDRLMWGSDWPVCNMACSYDAWVKISNQFLFTMSDADRMTILGGTAQRFYSLG